jgi:outer membrane immunogenic protein
MSKRVLASAGALVVGGMLAASSALAADLSISSEPIPGSAPVISWTGFYAGLNGAYGWGSSGAALISPIVGSGVNVTSISGALVGGTVGYNWQTSSNFVFGVEADAAAGKIGGTSFLPNVPTAAGTTATMNLNWLATVRARLGWTTNSFGGPTLWYITGGAAWAGATRYVQNFYNPGVTTTATYAGWTVGAGVEHAITSHWSIKAEYLYVDLGSADHIGGYGGGPIPPNPPSVLETTRVSAKTQLVRFGINYKF